MTAKDYQDMKLNVCSLLAQFRVVLEDAELEAFMELCLSRHVPLVPTYPQKIAGYIPKSVY